MVELITNTGNREVEGKRDKEDKVDKGDKEDIPYQSTVVGAGLANNSNPQPIISTQNPPVPSQQSPVTSQQFY